MSTSQVLAENMLRRTAPDEPVFVLRAQDALSTCALRVWIEEARDRGVSPHKIERAVRDLHEFEAWQLANEDLVKLPD